VSSQRSAEKNTEGNARAVANVFPINAGVSTGCLSYSPRKTIWKSAKAGGVTPTALHSARVRSNSKYEICKKNRAASGAGRRRGVYRHLPVIGRRGALLRSIGYG
jgi:hypothetical protein